MVDMNGVEAGLDGPEPHARDAGARDRRPPVLGRQGPGHDGRRAALARRSAAKARAGRSASPSTRFPTTRRSAPASRSRSGFQGSSRAPARPSTRTWTPPSTTSSASAGGRPGSSRRPRRSRMPWTIGRTSPARCRRPSEEAIEATKTLCTLHLGHLRALPGDDRPVPDDRLVPGLPPRRRLLRPLLPGGGAAAPRPLAHARLARPVGRAGPEDQVLALGDLRLELGGTLTGARLAYKTHGELTPARDNAILYPHMYSGTQTSLESTIAPGRRSTPSATS